MKYFSFWLERGSRTYNNANAGGTGNQQKSKPYYSHIKLGWDVAVKILLFFYFIAIIYLFMYSFIFRKGGKRRDNCYCSIISQ